MPLGQFQSGDTRKGVSHASVYRYPAAAFGPAPSYVGAPVNEDGAETLYRIRLDEPAVNIGAAVIASSPGSLIHPWVLGSPDENDVQGYAGTPVNVNNLTVDYPLDIGAAATIFPRTKSYYVAVDSGRDQFTGRSLGGSYVLRAWVDDLQPPLLGLITSRVAAGRPTIALRVLDLGAGVDPYSLVIGYGRALVGAAAYDPVSGIALFPLPRQAPALKTGKRLLTASAADFQEAKNVDSVGDELLPEHRVRLRQHQGRQPPGRHLGHARGQRVHRGAGAAPRARVLDGRAPRRSASSTAEAARDRQAGRRRPLHRRLEARRSGEGQAHAAGDRHRREGSQGRSTARRARLQVELRRVKVAVVTGASSGIGAATARELARQGWHCVLVARRQERLEPLAAELGGEYELCDVSDRSDVDRAAAAILTRHPSIGLLVNNAGIPGRGSFFTLEPERIEAVLQTNYLGGVWFVRALEPGLQAGLARRQRRLGRRRRRLRAGRAVCRVEARAARVLALARRTARPPRCAGAHRPPGLRRDRGLPAEERAHERLLPPGRDRAGARRRADREGGRVGQAGALRPPLVPRLRARPGAPALVALRALSSSAPLGPYSDAA